MREIALPLTGGCYCGAARYELNAAPLAIYLCHCTDCQRQSGSAFGMSMPVPRPALRVTAGDPARFERTTATGRRTALRFCATCASRLYSESTPEMVMLRPGTLDDTTWLRPSAQIWSRSAHDWACVDDILTYEQAADGFADLVAAWEGQGLRFVAKD
jgi:hypothetical protein